ncbi:MAG: 30S ribosomal protein S6 [Puniceicoccales bacterium]|jgi:ribosomal protein S6|nr:30S ribosomal protein S6 [Puniceicoccales bacterium]
MQRKYRITLIFDNREQKESVDDLMGRVAGYMESLGGVIDERNNLGLHSFERCVNRNFRSGTYAQYVVRAEGNFNGMLCNRLRLDRAINRVLVERIK